ncbi:tetratricopeptide repeat protein [Amorphus sp. 3PC139-8]|uniref:tetratricopeptide repeat protein n=1 Tax=Amorphus sp. 3PC139-8 TaxID=2735676 RepID=UPI00345DAE49
MSSWKAGADGLRWAIVVLCAGVCFTGPAKADELGDALEAASREDYARAATMLEPLAKAGDANAQQTLATLYAEGLGVAPDADRAFALFQAAAEQHHPVALYNMAEMARNGRVNGVGDGAAAEWLAEAAELGYGPAGNQMGALYLAGDGVTKSSGAAARFFRIAAVGGNPDAQFNLANLFRRGEGVPESMAWAYHWYSEAALQGQTQAMVNLGLMYATGTGVAEDMVAAASWMASAAEAEDPLGQRYLGQMYRDGDGVGQDPVAALKWYILAAAQGDQEAKAAAGELKPTMSDTQASQAAADAKSWIAAHSR